MAIQAPAETRHQARHWLLTALVSGFQLIIHEEMVIRIDDRRSAGAMHGKAAIAAETVVEV
jgi:hypothetical protein